MLDKIRLHAAGQLPPDYVENLGEHQFTLDGRCCRFLGVPYSEIKKHTLAGEGDEAVLNWAHAHGASRTDEECNVWNRFIARSADCTCSSPAITKEMNKNLNGRIRGEI